MKPEISIIIPCFNAAKTIEAALLGIPNNNFGRRIEVILIDDGSSDDTVSIARACRADIQIVSTENRGASAARNLGIRLARGNWMQFLDADDCLISNSVWRRLDFAVHTNADVLISDWVDLLDRYWLPKGLPADPLLNGCHRSACWKTLSLHGLEVACATSFWAPPASILYRRSIVEKVGSFRPDLPIIQDARFLFDAAFLGGSFVHFTEIAAGYRISHDSLSRSNPGQFLLDCMLNGEQIEELWITRYGKLDGAKHDAILKIFSSSAVGMIRIGHPHALIAIRALDRRGYTLSFLFRVYLSLAEVLDLNSAQYASKLILWVGRVFRWLVRLRFKCNSLD